eukprot:Partr_v1_DN28244_c4_g1_i8_m76038 putative alkaline ceramidase
MSARIIEGGHMGHWSPRTSTLDWCEENYVVMHYIAEFWNTISNGSFMLLALLGVYRWWRFGLELRFLVAYLSLFVIGVGSAFFHATLLYEMQLLDELPMLFGAAVLFYCTLEKHKELKYGIVAPIALTTFTVGVMVAYVVTNIPVLHHGTYGLMTALVIVDTIYLARKSDRAVSRFLAVGAATYVTAFAIWNVDNLMCDVLRDVRTRIVVAFDGFAAESMPLVIRPFTRFTGLLIASVFQFHAWWHLMSGWGAYLVIVFIEFYRVSMGLFTHAPEPLKQRSNIYHSKSVKMDSGEDALVGISFIMKIIPYIWIERQKQPVPKSPKRRSVKGKVSAK